MDGTPLYDIKPYVPYSDSHPEATGGFAFQEKEGTLNVVIAPTLLAKIPQQQQASLQAVLAQDPRPAYLDDPQRIYGLDFAGFNIRFTVAGHTLTVQEIAPLEA